MNLKHSIVAALAVLVIFLCSPLLCSATDDPLATVIQNVRENESLYANIEVTLRSISSSEGRPIPPDPDPKRFVANSQDATISSIQQNGMYRVDVKADQVLTTGGQFQISNSSAFDGETTRLFNKNLGSGNIVSGKRIDKQLVSPHMLLFRRMGTGCSGHVDLSTYFSGHEALKSDPDCKWRGGELSITYIGEEQFAGLHCHRVSVTAIDRKVPRCRWDFWLPEQRNYIPSRLLTWTFDFSKDIPVGERVVNDWKEIKPGIWFPVSAEFKSYDKKTIHRDHRQEISWREQHIVESVALNPQHDVSFFRAVEFPKGTAVYEIVDNKIQKSYAVGAPSSDESPSAKQVASGWWMLWVNMLAVVVLAIFIVRKYRKRNV